MERKPPEKPWTLPRSHYIAIGGTPQEADLSVKGRAYYNETGDVAALMAAQWHLNSGIIFRSNSRRWFRKDIRPANVHYCSDSEYPRWISVQCSPGCLTPNYEQPYEHKELGEPKVFVAGDKLYTFDKWWVTCKECIDGIKCRL